MVIVLAPVVLAHAVVIWDLRAVGDHQLTAKSLKGTFADAVGFVIEFPHHLAAPLVELTADR